MTGNKNSDNYFKKLLSRKGLFIGIFLVLPLLFWTGNKNNLFGQDRTRIGILPFQIFCAEKVDYLNEVIPANLAQHLKETAGVEIVDQQEIKSLLGAKSAGVFNLQELKQIADKTGSRFIVYGSLTKIEDNLSVDARVFTSLEGSPPYKDFVEGKDLDLLLKNLGGKISTHVSKVVLASSPPVVPAEAPKEMPSTGTEVAGEEIPSPAPAIEETPLLEAKTVPQGEEKKVTKEQEITSRAEPTPVIPASEAPSERPKKSNVSTEALLRPKALSSDQPVNITSDRMVADNRNRAVNFLGNVVAKREDMIIFSDQLTAIYTEDGKIEKIISRGNVKINQTDRIATCQEATFFQLRQQIIMTGKPKVWQGKNIITGDKIIIFVKEDRVEVEGEKKGEKQGRVNAIIYPQGKESKK